jgi:pyrroline-5-carboxylate reductase
MSSLLPPDRQLGVIGAGVMGRTLLRGLFDAQLLQPSQAWASAHSQASCDEVTSELGIPCFPGAATDLGLGLAQEGGLERRLLDTDVVLICVKPKQAADVVDALARNGVRRDTLLVSILAGVTTSRLEQLLDLSNPWVRAMPNTPCVVGAGMTVVAGGTHASTAHLDLAQRIFASVGQCRIVDEAYCNAVTALSGSGPAYMYLMMEAMADAGVRVGLPRDLALQLVAQTMLGSARMVLETGRHPASLRDDVTTPAGCTIGGVLMLEDGKIRSVLARAVEEATRIVEQLGKTAKAKAD